jgi:hypothetical protein
MVGIELVEIAIFRQYIQPVVHQEGCRLYGSTCIEFPFLVAILGIESINEPILTGNEYAGTRGKIDGKVFAVILIAGCKYQ